MTKSSIILNVDSKLLNSSVYYYLKEKEDMLYKYIDALYNSVKVPEHSTGVKKEDKELMNLIFHTIDKQHIIGIIYYEFLKNLTFRESDYEDYVNLLQVTISVGKGLVSAFLRKLRINTNQTREIKLSYSEVLDKWASENTNKALFLKDDTFLAKLGSKIIDILEFSGMLKKVIITISKTEKHYILDVVDEKLLNKLGHRKFFLLPNKLPMVCKPREYSETSMGGYLLNNEEFSENVFIEKKAYGVSSEICKTNQIYSMINNISQTAFKINTELLNYITSEKGSIFLEDPRFIHEYESLKTKTKRQLREIKSYKSKLLLQEMVLDIADFYKSFNEIYFPVRLDQRGRFYCTPNYFNYQSNELSKSLLSFSIPGTIERYDEESMNYIKVYGANCYGGSLSKRSTAYKCAWVDKNKEAIINYEENTSFVEKAKDKLLFLSFCIEYKRYIEFLSQENRAKFETYLPVQLDATCNGFQHMAMLSDEEAMFEQLNLVTTSKNAKITKNIMNKDRSFSEPEDFYSFILHILLQKFKVNLDKGIEIDNESKGSYKRLNEFIWDRKHIKKIIMTIPYNASNRSMKKYFLDELTIKERKDDTTWYSDIKDSEHCINSNDATLLIKSIEDTLVNDYAKINKLRKYLKNIAKLFNTLNMPITWNLPSGLIVNQRYLETKTTSISPFAYSKSKLNLKTIVKGKYDQQKQIRSLMPNLIHSLDGNSLCKLYYFFCKGFNSSVQFFSIHDCFATTCDKVARLKHILAAVYTDLYSNDHYLIKFDEHALNLIKNMTHLPIENRTITLHNGDKFIIHDIKWVLNKRTVSNTRIKKIDSQHILV